MRQQLTTRAPEHAVFLTAWTMAGTRGQPLAARREPYGAHSSKRMNAWKSQPGAVHTYDGWTRPSGSTMCLRALIRVVCWRAHVTTAMSGPSAGGPIET